MAFSILLESGDSLLLESGDLLLLEQDAEAEVATYYIYTPPTFEVRPPTSAGDAIVRGWGARAPGVSRGYLVFSTDGVTFTLKTTATPDELAAANFYALGGHETLVTDGQKTAIEASGVGGTFVAV